MESDPTKVNSSWLEPNAKSNAEELQRVATLVDSIRGRKILSAVNQLLSKGEKTLIVYGSAHFFKQAKTLEEVFGPPQIECRSPQ